MKTKVCTKCGEEKAVSEYYKKKSRRDGLNSYCKICACIDTKKWKDANKERVKEYGRKYNIENKEKVSELGKKWYKKNKKRRYENNKKWFNENKERAAEISKKYRESNSEKCKERSRIYYEKNKDRILESSKNRYKRDRHKKAEYAKKWLINNRDKEKAIKQKRRARKADNGGSFTAEEWKALCKKYDYKCLCCGKKKKLTADHVIPVSKGGTSYISNIQPLCKSCNSSKGAWHSTDYRNK